MKLLSAIVTAGCILGFAGAAAACPFMPAKKPDQTAETVPPIVPPITTGS